MLSFFYAEKLLRKNFFKNLPKFSGKIEISVKETSRGSVCFYKKERDAIENRIISCQQGKEIVLFIYIQSLRTTRIKRSD